MWRRIWPDVRDITGAKRTTLVGSWLVLLYAVAMFARNIVLGFTQDDVDGGLIAAAIIGGAIGWLAWSIRRGWRRIAASGLGFMLALFLVDFSRGELPSVFDVIGLVGTIYGVRGTFALGRLAGVPIVESTV